MKVMGIVGYSGAGKTTLIEKLLAHYQQQGLRVSIIKHSHKGFDIDQPGKDSWRHRQAGASEVLIASDQRWVLMHELRQQAEPSLFDLLPHFSPCDLVLVEGYKSMPIPKLEVWRRADQVERGAASSDEHAHHNRERPLRYVSDPHIVALASDQTDLPDPGRVIPVMQLDQIDVIADWITQHAIEVNKIILNQ